MANRNPVRHHGTLGAHSDNGKTLYASIPMELARSSTLSPSAKAVALCVWSHDEKYQQSAAEVAKAIGMTRMTVGKALVELQKHGWFVREVHKKIGPSGKIRISSERWHLQLTNRPFTPAEIEKLSGTTEPVSDDPDVPKNCARSDQTCLENEHVRAENLGTPPAKNLGTIVVNGGVHAVHSRSERSDVPTGGSNDLPSECAECGNPEYSHSYDCSKSPFG